MRFLDRPWFLLPIVLALMVLQWWLFVEGVRMLQQGETVQGALNIVVAGGGITARYWFAILGAAAHLRKMQKDHDEPG